MLTMAIPNVEISMFPLVHNTVLIYLPDGTNINGSTGGEFEQTGAV